MMETCLCLMQDEWSWVQPGKAPLGCRASQVRYEPVAPRVHLIGVLVRQFSQLGQSGLYG